MKIVNISHVSFPKEHDPELWIKKSYFFKGIWEAVARLDEVIFIDFIGYEGKRNKSGIQYWFYKKSKKELRVPLTIHRVIAAQNPDIVIVHGMHFPLQVLLLRLIVGPKCSIIIQDHGGGYFHNPLKRMLQKLADRFVSAYFFAATAQADALIQKGIIRDKGKIREVMEISSVFKPNNKDESREITGVSGNHTYIWVGHLNNNKDPMLAVKAFTEFIAEGRDVALYMLFQSTELLPEIQLWLQRYPLVSQRIHLIGKVPHDLLLHWYNSVEFIIATSHYEAAGVSVSEGMSCGCIPVLSNIPSFLRMTQGQCGIIFESGNGTSLLHALRDTYSMDKDREKQKTLLQFNTHLSFPAIAQRIHEVLYALLAKQ